MAAPTKVTKDIDYQKLRQEMDSILNDLQSGELGIEEAMVKYKRGQEVLEELEAFLKTAENKVRQINSKSADT